MNYRSVIKESLKIHEELLESRALEEMMHELCTVAVDCLRNGGKIMFCGNGGSAADAQHLAAELSGRFACDRPPLYAEALHVNTSYLTAVANDYSFAEVYARLVKGMGRQSDLLIALSTSGNSENIINAINAANEIGIATAGFTGAKGGKMKDICDILIRVPSSKTARIQEMHIMLGHILCEAIESAMFPENTRHKND